MISRFTQIVMSLWIVTALLVACQPVMPVQEGQAPAPNMESMYIAGMTAYIYGYPMVVMDVTREVLTAVPAPHPEGRGAPINQFTNTPHYVTPDMKNVVRISRDSLWTTVWLDLDKEPIILSVPDTHDRYYVFSMMNMWTDVFGSVGKRTHGTAPANFLIAGPKWQGEAPTDITETFHSSTRYAWIAGQTQANGEADFAAVNALQAQYKLTPLSAWGQSYSPPASVPVNPNVNTQIPPPNQVAAMDAGTFFNRLALALKDNSPYAADAEALATLKRIGVKPGQPFDITQINPALAKVLEKAVQDAQAKMSEGSNNRETENGWVRLPNLGRYGTDYVTRAGIAKEGLGANMQEDTIYPMALVDGDGNLLDSAHNYVMHFDKDQFPPTNATWSFSLYQGPNYVPNAIDRYHIAPWMPLQYNADGSLDIYLQNTSPGPDKEANWLPTPATGDFNITIRNYWPKAEALDGRYQIPPIQRVQ